MSLSPKREAGNAGQSIYEGAVVNTAEAIACAKGITKSKGVISLHLMVGISL